MEPLFKIGDRVKIKKRIYGPHDYKYSFIDEMTRLSRKIFTIKKIFPDVCREVLKVPDDNAKYILQGDASHYSWSSGMLELVSEKEEFISKLDNTSKITLSKRNKIKLNFKL